MSDAPQHPSRLTLTLLAAMLLATGVINAGAARHDAAGAKAVSFTLPARHGTVALDSLRGRVVLVDFWASWCEPCRKSFPWMKTMVERYGAKGFTVVAIDLDKERADALAFLERYDAPFPVAFDPSGQTAEAYKVGAMPTSVLVDRAGTIVYTHAGFDAHAAVAAESLIAGACAR